MLVVWKVFSLPVLEPLTPDRLKKVITIAMTCIYAAITTATAASVISVATGQQVKATTQPKDDEADAYSSSIIQKSVSNMIEKYTICHRMTLKYMTLHYKHNR